MDVNECRIEQAAKRPDAQAARFDRIDAAIGELRVSVARVEASLAQVIGSVAGLRTTVIITGIAAVGVVIAGNYILD